ncbi:MAG: hypothetical protein ACOZEN_14445 [Thermodesulfobacteriota bacterium]
MTQYAPIIFTLMLGGCALSSPYPKNASKECKEIIDNTIHTKRYTKNKSEILAIYPSIKERYEYYICMNTTFHHRWVTEEIFLDDAHESAKYIGSILPTLNDDSHLFQSILLLCKINDSGKYNVSTNKGIILEILRSRDRMRVQSPFLNDRIHTLLVATDILDERTKNKSNE